MAKNTSAKTKRRQRESVHRRWALKKRDEEYSNDWAEWLKFVSQINLPEEDKKILSTNPILFDKRFQKEAGHLTREERIVLQKADSFHAKHGIWPTAPESQENPFQPDYIAVRRIYPPYLKENEIGIAIKLDNSVEDIEYEMKGLVRLARASRGIEPGSRKRKRFDRDAKTFKIYDLYEAGYSVNEIANVLYEEEKDQRRKAVDIQERDKYEQDLISKGYTEGRAEDFADYKFCLIDDPEGELIVLTEIIQVEKGNSEEAARKAAKQKLNRKRQKALKKIKDTVRHHIKKAETILAQPKAAKK